MSGFKIDPKIVFNVDNHDEVCNAGNKFIGFVIDRGAGSPVGIAAGK